MQLLKMSIVQINSELNIPKKQKNIFSILLNTERSFEYAHTNPSYFLFLVRQQKCKHFKRIVKDCRANQDHDQKKNTIKKSCPNCNNDKKFHVQNMTSKCVGHGTSPSFKFQHSVINFIINQTKKIVTLYTKSLFSKTFI